MAGFLGSSIFPPDARGGIGAPLTHIEIESCGPLMQRCFFKSFSTFNATLLTPLGPIVSSAQVDYRKIQW